MKERFVRFMPRTREWSMFAGWEGKAVPAFDVDDGMYRVRWQRRPQGLPELVHANHLSFKIRKFSSRFAP